MVASQEWDLTASLPQVGANTGIEAVEWVADADLAGLLWDDNDQAPYDPTSYPGHGDGLFFVAIEDNGGVYAYALNADGRFNQVAFIDPGLPGVMSLDWDTVAGGLWAKCDNGCANQSAFIKFTGTQLSAQNDDSSVTIYAAPTGLPDDNFEGFATSTIEYCVNGERPVWWFVDGVQPGALRSGTLPCSVPAATLTIDPASWLDDQPVTLTGTGFEAGEVVVITSTLPDGSVVEVARVSADAAGGFSWQGVLPVAGYGDYRITATGLSSERVASLGYNRASQGSQPPTAPSTTPPSGKPTVLPKTGDAGQAAWALVAATAGLALAAARLRR